MNSKFEMKEKRIELLQQYNHLLNHYKNIPQDQINRWVKNLVIIQEKHVFNMISNCKMGGLFRARKHNRVDGIQNFDEHLAFTCESQFWNPPADICKLGRCNDKNESMFYCTNNLTTAIVEVKPEIGEFVTVALFKPKKPESYNGARLSFVGINTLIKINELQNFFGNGYDREAEEIELDDKYNELFHQEIKNGNSDLYKLSLAVTKSKMTTLFDPDQQVFYEMHGMLYSSIEHKRRHFNLVYRPDHIRLHYGIAELRTYKVVDKTEKETILVEERIGHRHKAIIQDPFDYFGLKWQNSSTTLAVRVIH